MLPHFRADGLVVTRAQSDYHVGDVVAYHNAELNAVVMHRIVGVEGGRYTFKGDNRPTPDSYVAKRADLIGSEVAYWPGGGRYLRVLRAPMTFALLMSVIGLLAGLAVVPRRNRRRRVRRG